MADYDHRTFTSTSDDKGGDEVHHIRFKIKTIKGFPAQAYLFAFSQCT